jgi:hypothetical protein
MLKKTSFTISLILAIFFMFNINGNSYQGKEYTIKQDGGGDFKTIQEGVDFAQSGDTLTIYPGIYNEHIVVKDKALTLQGTDKASCIIQSNGILYQYPPLTMSAGVISNLTIYSMDDGKTKPQLMVDSYGNVGYFKGYAIHIDDDYLYGKSLTISNCLIMSDNSQCVGIGTRGDSTITFKDCDFYAMGEGGCLYLHDTVNENLGGVANIVIKNCSMTSYTNPYIMSFESLTPSINNTYFTFQNNKLRCVAYNTNDGYSILNKNTFMDVETISLCEEYLKDMGYYPAISPIVNYMSNMDAYLYISTIYQARQSKNMSNVLALDLKEGINYLGDMGFSLNDIKHQSICISNKDNLIGDGWLGLEHGYLTKNSFGNSLIELNAK